MSDSATLPTGGVPPRPPGRAGAEHAAAYAAARRHSARVRFLKRAIPIGAVVAIVAVLVVGLFDPFGRLQGVTLGPVSLSGTKVTMEQPRLSGFRKDAQPYEVTAVSASQDVRKPTIVELKELKARVALDQKGFAHLQAATGVYDTQKEQLELQRNVLVRTDSGYDARLQSASVDFKAGTVVSNEPVRVEIKGGTIEAESLQVSDNGKRIAFIGRVRTVFDRGQFGAGPAVAQPATTTP
ncbi:LPS export ABC transporter periplasmic protein LptC [Chelatococcus sp. SYSU_G07232]|uniref:LPS export ABC transporter periplasmic protein LptC n=1 Tax=Chelatococcus albus TaxID=3047466 RepID=A0ABT7AHB8_9HYPH|nr:LPS export ABC transporter periplasmic protein LptC [Chelatococcus sp. SYSU_G07232]MDJ1158781.1 LPS export ABC transporter periplasmic protein LptC [Chelatococcus sp. SYSU_G07232]